MRIIHLEISSWKGISFGAIHTYGNLVWGEGRERKCLELFRPITAKEAKDMNREHGSRIYKAGDQLPGFPDEPAVIKAAIKRAIELCPNKNFVLLKSRYGCVSARPLIWFPNTLKEKAARINALAEEWEKIDGYEGNERRAGEIDNEWLKLMREIDPDL